MTKFIRQYVAAPALIFSGLFIMVLFQNCSSDVGFNQDQARPVDPNLGQNGNGGPGQIGVGGSDQILIEFNEVPTDTTQDNADTAVDYTVTVPGGGISTINCFLDGSPVACGAVDRIPIVNPGVGEHTFSIEVVSNIGTQVAEDITWTVYREIVLVERDISVTVQGSSVDIIINVDNSGSMLTEQQNMAARIANFMEPFQNLDYHIAITTTSPSSETNWRDTLNYVDGKFVPLVDGGRTINCIKASEMTNIQQAQDLISNNVVRSLYLFDENGNRVIDNNGNFLPEGNGWERGIYTTYLAVERHNSDDPINRGCLRDNVPKHVIVISDERETLRNEKTLVPFDEDLYEVSKSRGTNLVNFMAASFGVDTLFKWHSIVVNPYTDEGRTCLDGAGGRPGTEYVDLSIATGGYIGSICADDYALQLGAIGQQISNSALSYNLGCVAIPNADGETGRVVDSNGDPISTNFNFNGDKVEFAQLLGQGEYRVEYYCYQ